MGYDTKKMLVGRFKWIIKKYVSNFAKDFKKYDEDSKMGYFIDVDLEYLEELGQSYNNLPFFP